MRLVALETYDYSLYASCNHGCTATSGVDPVTGKAIPAHWRFGRIHGLFHQPALAFTHTGEPRLAAFTPAEDDQGGDQLVYMACAVECEENTSWARSTITGAAVGAGVGHKSVVLRLNSQDQPRMALFATGSHSIYLWCNENCSNEASWGMRAIDPKVTDGGDPDLQFDQADHPRIAYQWREDPTSELGRMGLGYAWCDANCESPQAVFAHSLVELSTQLDVEWPLPRPSNCVWGQWLGAYRPALVLDAQDNPYVAYDADFVVGSCLGQPGTDIFCFCRR
jgi:hypothetical protein